MDETDTDDTDTNSECVCTTGDCCDGCDFLPASVLCAEEPESLEYQCSSLGCGADAQQRGLYRHCSGSSADCTAQNLQSGEWEIIEYCGENELCVADDEDAYCESCDGEYFCVAGECVCEPSFTEHIVEANYDWAWWIHAADLDGDGDMDVLGAASMANTLNWWKNLDGLGTSWEKQTIESYCYAASSVNAADMDGDGDVDVIGTSHNDNSSDGDIFWWENSAGDGTAWISHIVENDFTDATVAQPRDIDGDGDFDLVGLSSNISSSLVDIAWWENMVGDGTAWYPVYVTSDFDDAASLYADDVDGDEDVDIVSANYFNQVILFENTDGTGASWAQHDVDDDFDYPDAVSVADLDGDGDNDILGAGSIGDSGEIVWWENKPDDDTSWTEYLINDSAQYVRAIHPVDVDNDGDVDVLAVASTYAFGEVTLYRNEFGDGMTWSAFIVDNAAYGAQTAYSADFDGDAIPELLVTGHSGANDDKVSWWDFDCSP